MGGGEWSRVKSSEVEADDVAWSGLHFPRSWARLAPQNAAIEQIQHPEYYAERTFDSDSLDCPRVYEGQIRV